MADLPITTFGNRPLWLVIEDSENELLAKERETGESFDDGHFNAARIRAVRDWLPQPKEPQKESSDEAWAIWEERKAIRELLTAEADCALLSRINSLLLD